MSILKLLLLSFLIVSFAIAQEEKCDEKDLATKLQEKIELPPGEFKHRGYVSPDEFNKLSSREIAELLIKRNHRECDEIRGAKEGVALEEESDIMMYVPSAAFAAIEKYGFHNQHVTRTTSGANTREGRYNSEVQFPGMILGYNSKTKDLLPKYAALNIQKDSAGYTKGSADYYGDVIIVFKPDVKKRTTWTNRDSLGTVPFRGSVVTNTLKFKDKKEDPVECWGYCEAQVWGDLDLSDVEYAMIGPGGSVPPELSKNGISTYYTKDKADTTMGIEKGDLALAGEANKVPKSLSGVVDEKTWKEAKGKSDVVDRVLEHKLIPTMKVSELTDFYQQTFDLESKREILGQIALTKNDETKKFLMNGMGFVSDSISRSQIMLGLSSYGDDPKVRTIFLNLLKSKANKVVNPMQAYTFGVAMTADDIDLLTALAIIADTDGYKDDASLKEALEYIYKNSKDNNFNTWYKRLILKESLCSEEATAKEKASPWGYGGGYSTPSGPDGSGSGSGSGSGVILPGMGGLGPPPPTTTPATGY